MVPQGRAILGDGARLLAALHLGDEWRVQRVGDLERSCLAPVIAMRKPRLRKKWFSKSQPSSLEKHSEDAESGTRMLIAVLFL